MEPKDLEYSELKKRIASYESKGRSESAAFLNWFLENVYRLDDVAADDAICDQPNDKGIDAIYLDHNEEEIHFFQSKIRQNAAATVGDVSLKNLAGSLAQFQTPAAIDALLQGQANANLKRIIAKSDLKGLIEAGYKVIGVLVTNEMIDKAAREYLAINSTLTVYDRKRIAAETIDVEKSGGITDTFSFEVDYVAPLKFDVGTEATAYVFPALASELVKLKGISDGTLFSQNVRLALGSTPVNRAIAKSIQDKGEHRYFSLFHNGVILLCGHATLDKGRLAIKDYVVVNGAQSLSTFFKNESEISSDLRILVKIIALRNAPLAQKITLNSNNQNAIKPRDGLTRYFLLHVVSEIIDGAGKDRAIVANPKAHWKSKDLQVLYKKIEELLKGLIVDLNYEVKEVGEAFDYKADLKSPKSVDEWTAKLMRNYEKDVQRGKAIAFE
jgi:hypothetical protein